MLRRSRVTSVALAFGVVLLATQISGTTIQVPSGTWQQVGSLSSVRSGSAAALLADGNVLVTGGDIGSSAVASVELFDVNTGTFSPAASMSVARTRHTAVTLVDGRVLVAGGRSADGSTLRSAEIFDPGTGTWTAAGNMAQRRASHTASLLGDGRVLIAGGDKQPA